MLFRSGIEEKVSFSAKILFFSGEQNEGAGDTLLILEAMKMENEISAPQDGTIASVNVRKGDVVNSGDLLITMN